MTTLALAISGILVPGGQIQVDISGLTPGEPTFLLGSEELGSQCSSRTAPICADLQSPTVISQGTPLGTGATLSLTLPSTGGTYYLQAISSIEASEVYILDVQGVALISGMAIVCDVDLVDIGVEHFEAPADIIRINGYESGALVVGYDEDPAVPDPGQIFATTWLYAASAPNCDGLTWTAETINSVGSMEHCVVRGPEESDLKADGVIPSTCQSI